MASMSWPSGYLYVGETGWELYIPTGDAVFVWDLLWQAGLNCDVQAFGYKAVDALRLEKGYAAFPVDISAGENPYEARLGFCVKLDAGDFIGRQALLQKKSSPLTQRLHTLIIGGNGYPPRSPRMFFLMPMGKA
jgi:4-methylaminobutanoate oxidase (formaldehyde-forming)